jgi:hypothetical protein
MKTKEEFIAFFEAIPEEQWCMSELTNSIGQHCALGHLGFKEDFPSCLEYTGELSEGQKETVLSLAKLLGLESDYYHGVDLSDAESLIYDINDGTDWKDFEEGFSPKKRILNRLNGH